MEDLEFTFLNFAGAKQDPRRKQERQDFNMIREDKSAMANLPRKAQHREFPKGGGYFMPEWD